MPTKLTIEMFLWVSGEVSIDVWMLARMPTLEEGGVCVLLHASPITSDHTAREIPETCETLFLSQNCLGLFAKQSYASRVRRD
jgi:hypothetical protein